MTVQVNIPPDLPDSDKAIIFETLDAHLNAMILNALLNGMYIRSDLWCFFLIRAFNIGIYTGIVAITLWDICEPGNIPTILHRLKKILQI